MYGSQLAARYMKTRNCGSIINLASIAALNPGFAIATYRASKAGVINFTKSLAIDLGEYGIRVNAIAPGSIPTSMGKVSTDGLTMVQAASYFHAHWLKMPSAKPPRPLPCMAAMKPAPSKSVASVSILERAVRLYRR